jgi:Ca-activated chloride channel family protein
MRFEHASLLWLLLVVPPALVLFFWWGSRMRRKLLTQFVEARLLESLTVGLSPIRRQIRFALVILAVALLIVAVAQPQHGFDLQEVEQRGLDIVVAVDTSKSMLATDIPPNRLTRAKLAALELMQKAATDRLGLVAFAGEAFLECPLTADNTAFQQNVEALDVNSIPQGGTAIREAINTALAAFKEKDRYKALVLLTDGEDNDEGALDAAQNAAKEGLKIFTIGIGSTAGALLDPNLVRDPDGNAVKSHLNETLLQQIAAATGGFYLPLRGADTMEVLYDRGLAPLPKAERAGKMIRRYHEQYRWPLAIAMILLLTELFLPERQPSERRPSVRRREARPAEALLAAANPPPSAVALLAGILLLPAAIKASPAGALRDYQAGNFTNALTEFSRLAGVQTNDLRLVFNAGDAAYRATNFDLAQSLFTQVTVSPDLKMQQQAFYNLGNVQFQQAKLAKDLDGFETGLEQAEKTYERAVNLNTNDPDAGFNLQFTKNTLEQIKRFKEALLRAKNEADAAVRRAEFHRALEIMEPLQKSVAAKQFEDFIKKLKNIDEIENPHQPQP